MSSSSSSASPRRNRREKEDEEEKDAASVVVVIVIVVVVSSFGSQREATLDASPVTAGAKFHALPGPTRELYAWTRQAEVMCSA